MRIYVDCKMCDSPIPHWTWSSDRVEFEMEKGKEIELYCNKCNRTYQYKVGEFYARSNKIKLLIALLILLGGTPAVAFLVLKFVVRTSFSGMERLLYLAVMPIGLYVMILREDKKRVRLFNES